MGDLRVAACARVCLVTPRHVKEPDMQDLLFIALMLGSGALSLLLIHGIEHL